ncbi:autotransporter domain-containing protein [Bradyrhizobium sp. CCGUVB1N3]|uniref:autotransporter outer membrane beta-barrel domain-containing protein n=1 Tax=Bradyrhizobium sp. CCGUVB1N3 TaxID=2949629 RepID=UPI0020B1C5C5|nr:autotransporter domain-containing protein [Bradyrhizobium sp. CCGUVB1N3]MCP3473102.1 autotransporter domain-containing protein [Bradyrhizobium sp. CCGUVB1N3]
MPLAALLLGSTALVAVGCMSPAEAGSSDWTGANSTNWYDPGNWSTNVPTSADTVTVDTLTPNATIISGGSASAQTLTVGLLGSGFLTVQNGGTLSVQGVDIAGLLGSTGGLTVTGAGSTLSSAGPISVGVSGAGLLSVLAGGAVTGTQVGLGAMPGATGSVTVDGAGSSITANRLYVGVGGTGYLNVTNGGSVTVATASVIGNAASASGSVLVDGANSTWTANGQLIIGSLGSATLTISNGGVVSAPGANPVAIADLSGSGTLNIGAAPGATPVAPGTLNAASVQFGFGTGTINFNHTGSGYVFAAAISGAGTINQLAGETILTADSSGFTGATDVSGGRLAVNGSLGGLVTVAHGGILGGTGTVGGIIAPGNSIGTLTTLGNVNFSTGSIYQVEVNAAGQSDKIVSGNIAIINGSTVQVLAGAGNYAASTNYTIITAAHGVSGTFDSVTSNLAYLTPSLSYDANDVYLTLTRNSVSFASVGVTPNQVATGGGLDSLGLGNALVGAMLNLSAQQSQNAFDQLSGEIHASAKGVLIDDSRFTRDAALDRLRAAFDSVGAPSMAYAAVGPVKASADTDRYAVWARGFGSWGSTRGDGNAASLSRSTGGIVVGTDGRVAETWRVGLLGGYGHSNVRVGDRRSSGSSDDYSLGLYGGTQWGNLAFRTGGIYTWHELSMGRTVAFPGFMDTLKSSYGARTAQAFGEFGYRIDAGRTALGKLSFEPFANLAYVNLSTDGFVEQGNAAALTSQADKIGVTFTTLGLRGASQVATLSGMGMTARGTLGWRHAFGDTTPLSTLAFSGGSAFTIAGVPIARDAALVEAGLDLAITPNATFGVAYGGQFARSATDQSVKGTFAVRF